MHRRSFLSGVGVGTASLLAPSFLTSSNASVSPDLSGRNAANAKALRLAPRALAALDRHRGAIPERDVIGIVDFAAPSAEPRFHLLDVRHARVLASELVAHGRGSDPENTGWVEHFSNEPGSNASSRGSFVTGELYNGAHGLSQRLIGLDEENSRARSRGIVIHAAAYVDTEIARSRDKVGRSQGCFAVSNEALASVLSCLGAGRLLFAWK